MNTEKIVHRPTLNKEWFHPTWHHYYCLTNLEGLYELRANISSHNSSPGTFWEALLCTPHPFSLEQAPDFHQACPVHWHFQKQSIAPWYTHVRLSLRATAMILDHCEMPLGSGWHNQWLQLKQFGSFPGIPPQAVDGLPFDQLWVRATVWTLPKIPCCQLDRVRFRHPCVHFKCRPRWFVVNKGFFRGLRAWYPVCCWLFCIRSAHHRNFTSSQTKPEHSYGGPLRSEECLFLMGYHLP